VSVAAAPTRQGMLLMAGFAALWAAVEVIAAGAMAHLPVAQVVWLRYVVHLVLMLVLFWPWQRSRLWRTRRPVLQVFRSLLMFAMPAGFALSVTYGVGIPTLMTVFWSSLVLIPVFARIIAGERVPGWSWLAGLVGWTGIWLMLGSPLPTVHPSVAFPMLMAGSFSLYVVLTRLLRTERTSANLFHTAAGVLLVLTPMMPFVWVPPTLSDLCAMALVGALGLVGLFLVDRMASIAAVSTAAPMAALQMPIFAALLWILGSRPPSLRSLLGMAIVVAAAALAWLAAGRDRGTGAVLSAHSIDPVQEPLTSR